jgi:transcriptional regulator with XRE-family HTH domain
VKKRKKERLEATGWKVGSTADLLQLSADEVALIEMKLALARNIRTRRKQRRLTQSQFAKIIGSSQSRVAKMEAADVSVSLDLLIRALLALGASRKEVARVIALEKVPCCRASCNLIGIPCLFWKTRPQIRSERTCPSLHRPWFLRSQGFLFFSAPG